MYCIDVLVVGLSHFTLLLGTLEEEIEVDLSVIDLDAFQNTNQAIVSFHMVTVQTVRKIYNLSKYVTY